MADINAGSSVTALLTAAVHAVVGTGAALPVFLNVAIARQEIACKARERPWIEEMGASEGVARRSARKCSRRIRMLEK
ncbi:hypothetical protein CAQ69_24345 [Stutzerimonas stutzeri]|nr:hypothetical protein CAQ69_24345 [Stutzerimonas stutzeri]PZR42405.1 MAG: hypothetical protein DI524_10830 [Pseudomonas oleovorans]